MSAAGSDNPIYEKFFKDRSLLSGKVFDDPRSVQFRKQLTTVTWLRETKPSSIPKASMIERRGTNMVHHVLWLKSEGNALRESLTYRSPHGAVRRVASAENSIRKYLNRVHAAVKRLKMV